MGLQSIQDRAMAEMGRRNPNAAFDPAIIMVIAEIIMQLVMVFQENCGEDPVDAAEKARNPSWWGRRYVALRARRALGRRGYREHGGDVVGSILKAGKGCTAEEMRAAYDETDD